MAVARERDKVWQWVTVVQSNHVVVPAGNVAFVIVGLVRLEAQYSEPFFTNQHGIRRTVDQIGEGRRSGSKVVVSALHRSTVIPGSAYRGIICLSLCYSKQTSLAEDIFDRPSDRRAVNNCQRTRELLV